MLRHLRASRYAALSLATSLLSGCLHESGPYGPTYYPLPSMVTQKYVYDCKRTRLGGEYCKAKPDGPPFTYYHFYPH